MNPVGVLVILFGLPIAMIPDNQFTLSFFGTIDGESLSMGTKLFYRVIGVFFVTTGFTLLLGY